MPHKSDVQVALISGGTSGLALLRPSFFTERRLVRSHQWPKRKSGQKS